MLSARKIEGKARRAFIEGTAWWEGWCDAVYRPLPRVLGCVRDVVVIVKEHNSVCCTCPNKKCVYGIIEMRACKQAGLFTERQNGAPHCSAARGMGSDGCRIPPR